MNTPVKEFDEVVVKDRTRTVQGYITVPGSKTDKGQLCLELSISHSADNGYSATLWRYYMSFKYGSKTVSIFEDSKKLIELDAVTSKYAKRFNKDNLTKIWEETSQIVLNNLPLLLDWASKKKLDH